MWRVYVGKKRRGVIKNQLDNVMGGFIRRGKVQQREGLTGEVTLVTLERSFL